MLIGLFNDSYLSKTINSWDDNFPTNKYLYEKELERIQPQRIKNLKNNIKSVISILYEKGLSSLFYIDMKLSSQEIELGGRSIGISNILDNLKKGRSC